MTIKDEIDTAFENHQSATCVILAEQWLHVYPDDLWVTYKYAEMLYRMARYDDAIRVYDGAIKRFPDERWGLYNQVGRMHRYRGAFDVAEVWFQKAIDLDPEAVCSYIFLGAVQARQGKLKQSEYTHRLATQCTDCLIDEAYHNLGLVLRGQGLLAEAKVCFEKAIEIDEDYSDAIEALKDVTTAISLTIGRCNA